MFSLKRVFILSCLILTVSGFMGGPQGWAAESQISDKSDEKPSTNPTTRVTEIHMEDVIKERMKVLHKKQDEIREVKHVEGSQSKNEEISLWDTLELSVGIE
jgi:hypothetical protein